MKVIGALIVLAAVIGVAAMVGRPQSPVDGHSRSSVSCRADDLQCNGNEAIAFAQVFCVDDVERLARYSMRWKEDGWLSKKFTHFKWLNQTQGTLTVAGDKAEFQNGFGAYSRVTYFCDIDPRARKVLEVRVIEGRLPPR